MTYFIHPAVYSQFTDRIFAPSKYLSFRAHLQVNTHIRSYLLLSFVVMTYFSNLLSFLVLNCLLLHFDIIVQKFIYLLLIGFLLHLFLTSNVAQCLVDLTVRGVMLLRSQVV